MTNKRRDVAEAGETWTPARPLTEAEIAEIDPGVRRTVAWMRAHGFDVTDSGDGKTKLTAGECGALDFPFVSCVVRTSARLQMDCERLAELLRERGIEPQPMHEALGNVEIHGAYDPAQPQDRAAVIVLYRVDDALLFGAEPLGAAV